MNNNNTTIEIWKDVKGYEGYYQVSNMGNVKSIDRVNAIGRRYKGQRLKLRSDRVGYKDVMLNKDGVSKRYKVHRLVAISFIDNPFNLPQVNHIDEVKDNNAVDNLEWCTDLYNKAHGSLKERRLKNGVKQGVAIRVIKEGKVTTHHSIKSASRHLNIDRAMIYNCLNGQERTLDGYRFEKVGDY